MLRLLCAGFLLSLLAASFFALTGQPHKGIEETLRRGPDGVIGMGFAMASMPPIKVNPPFQGLALPGDRIEYHESILFLGVTEIRCFQARLIRDGRELERWNDTALHPMVIMMLVALIPFALSVVVALFWRNAAGRKATVLALLLACTGGCATIKLGAPVKGELSATLHRVGA